MTKREMRREFIGEAFKLWAAKIEHCWAPGGGCAKKAIKAHSLQNSRVLDQLAQGGHVVMLTQRLAAHERPRISLREVGRNEATTFTGLCKEHDDLLFAPLEKRSFRLNDQEQHFLLAYRAVLRELHVCLEAASRLQIAYQRKVELGLEPRDIPTRNGMFATHRAAVAYETYEYKEEFDRLYCMQGYSDLEHDVFELDTQPSIAVSSLFSLDYVDAEHGVPRVALTIFPLDARLSLAIFSYLRSDAGYARLALRDVLESSGVTQKYLLSRLVLNFCDNIIISPSYRESMSEEKVLAIEKYFSDTVLVNNLGYESEHLYLF